MKGIMILSMILLVGCASTAFNTLLASKNMSLVEITHNSGLNNLALNSYTTPLSSPSRSSASYMGTTLQKINDKITSSFLKEYEVPAGKNTLFVGCKIITGSTYTKVYKDTSNTYLLDVDLEKGHTYELTPEVVKGLKDKPDSCIVKLIDITSV